MTATRADNDSRVLVVGAGVAGMAAATHLAAVGHGVYLLDTAPAIGGSMHLLDHTFPTNSCGLCLMLPHQPALCPTFECQQNERIQLLPYAEVVGVQPAGERASLTAEARSGGGLEPGAQPGEGTEPSFLSGEPLRITIRHKPRFVDAARCDGCGVCATVCPESRPHDHEGRLQAVKAIYRPAGLRAVPDTWLIDAAVCSRCGACVLACPQGAVDLDMVAREEEIEVGAVLLTPGFAPFDARLKGEYGYGHYDNVLTSLEFERLVSLAGSRVGRLVRPSDGRRPGRVAFVQCVGSRDSLCGVGHCSAACCMYTAKQVALAKKLEPELEVTVFYMDLRAFGKDFEAYVAGVQALPGVVYRRAMPSAVHQQQHSRDLRLSFVAEDGKVREQDFDLVVLALGFVPPPGAQALARLLGVELNEVGFAPSDGYHPARSGRPGVFVAGAFREPKDIPETVAEAAGAAAEVAAYLGRGVGGGGAVSAGRPLAELRDVADEEARVGVFVCQCQGELAPLGVAGLAAWAGELPGVVVAEVVSQGCTVEGRAALAAAIAGQKLNRVVLAGCTPRLFGAEFEALMAGAGLDGRLLARVNLREQVVLPHAGDGAGLEGKARSLVAMAVAGLRAMSGLAALRPGERAAGRSRRAVVVGGGAAGLSAALALAGLGVEVELVEREAQLGGQWRYIRHQLDGSNPQAALLELVVRVAGEPRIRVHLAAEVLSVEGQAGRYRTVIGRRFESGTGRGAEGDHGPRSAAERETVEHGVLLVATGGRPAEVKEYLYGEDPRVLTQRELEQQLADGTLARVRRVVMIQCVGSREAERPYCSRVCCSQAVKNALQLKALRPEVEVYVLYREVRTYGFREAAYQAAREAGVVFVRYEVERPACLGRQAKGLPGPKGGVGSRAGKPKVEAGAEGLRLSVVEPVTGQPLEVEADLLVLSVGLEPEAEGELAARLGVRLDGQGFFREEHPKMKPLDLEKAGLYVAGLAHSPRFLEETLAQGQGAAMRAAAYLAAEGEGERPTAVWVNERLCSYCGLCVAACPYGARVLDEEARVARVDYELCHGCGVCAVVCPNKATLQKAFEHKQLVAAIDAALL